MGLALRGAHRRRPRRPRPTAAPAAFADDHRRHPPAHARARTVEVLIPDCKGDPDLARRRSSTARPDVLNHNIETVARLQRAVRPSASYARSLAVLARAKAAGLTTKSGDHRRHGRDRRRGRRRRWPTCAAWASTSSPSASTCVRPTDHLPVARWWTPEEFDRAEGRSARRMGIAHVEASPLTRSSYHARRRRGRAPRAPRGGRDHARRADSSGSAPRMAEQGVDVLLLSVGPDLPWLTGYEAMPLERLTMLVVPRDGDATLVVPRLEAPRVVERARRRSRSARGTRPTTRSASSPPAGGRARRGRRSATGRGPGSSSTCRPRCPRRRSARRATVTGAAARGEGRRGDRRPAPRAAPPPTGSRRSCRAATSALVGRTEAEVSADIGRRLLAEGHQRVNFAIVGRRRERRQPAPRCRRARDRARATVVLCDFGGTMLADGGAGYCSDITRCVHLGAPPAEFAELYEVLQRGPGGGGRRGAGRHVVRGRSTPPPAASSPRRATASASSTAPATASASRSTRTPTSSPATARRCSPATRSRSSRASTRPGAGACGWRTSSSPPRAAPIRSTASTTTSSCSTPDQPATAAQAAPRRSATDRDGLEQDRQVRGERPVVDVVEVEAGVVVERGVAAAAAPATCR